MRKSAKSRKYRKIEKFMDKYRADITLISAQVAVFYVLPLLGSEFGSVMMVFTILLCTFALSLITACFSHRKTRRIYPVITPILFIPSIFIYYNSSALMHIVWYFVICILGFLLGLLIRKFAGVKSRSAPYNRKIKERDL